MSLSASFNIKLTDEISFDVSDRGQCNRLVELFLQQDSTYGFDLENILSSEEIDYINFESFYMMDGEFDGKEKVKSSSKLIPIFEKITSEILKDSKNHFKNETTDWRQSKYREYLFDLYFLGELQTVFKMAKQLNTDIEIVIWFE